MSHPTWVRGLKYWVEKCCVDWYVAPHMGAWIEIARY